MIPREPAKQRAVTGAAIYKVSPPSEHKEKKGLCIQRIMVNTSQDNRKGGGRGFLGSGTHGINLEL